jgi:hypothetical protein
LGGEALGPILEGSSSFIGDRGQGYQGRFGPPGGL